MTSSSSVQLISDVNLDLRASISEFLSCRIFSSLMAYNNKAWMNMEQSDKRNICSKAKVGRLDIQTWPFILYCRVC